MYPPNHRELTDISTLNRKDIVDYYFSLLLSFHIKDSDSESECKRINDMILSKYKPSGLYWIKEKAWEIARNVDAIIREVNQSN